MIKAIIFDLNGIFIQSPKLSERFAEKFGVPVEDFLPVLKEIMDLARQKSVKDSFYLWYPYLENWKVYLTKEQFFDFWFEAEKEVPEMIELVKNIKEKGIKVFILSNNFPERSAYYKQVFPFLDEIFDKVYYSWQTGLVKPNLKAYKNILKENNLKAKECLYFDDSQSNIEIANRLGINSFLYTGLNSLEEALEKYGI
ncbi:MAG: HAD family phosphatase [bacterium]|nr:HAD family phosphatase [bacterium]